MGFNELDDESSPLEDELSEVEGTNNQSKSKDYSEVVSEKKRYFSKVYNGLNDLGKGFNFEDEFKWYNPLTWF